MSVADTSNNAIRGWGSSPTGNAPTVNVGNENRTNHKCLPAIFFRGWRRNLLYGILIFLMILVFLNIALTLWIISALKLNMNGIGPIKIMNGGIQLEGQTWVVNNLVASTISTQPAHPITLHSHRNFTVLVSDPKHSEHSKLLIKRDNIEFSGKMFHVRDSRGGDVFRASKEEVRVYADTFAVDGVGGLVVKTALQVPLVRAPPGSDLHFAVGIYRGMIPTCVDICPTMYDYEKHKFYNFFFITRFYSFNGDIIPEYVLKLESLTRGLDLRAPQSIYFESRAGKIDVTSHTDLKLNSIVGAIKIDAPNIVITNLKEAHVTEKPQRGIRSMKVYQLCACATGKLFLAAPDAVCAAHADDTELCR